MNREHGLTLVRCDVDFSPMRLDYFPSDEETQTKMRTTGACAAFGADASDGLATLLLGGREIGERLVDDTRVSIISATGSTRMGRTVGERVARRFACWTVGE